MRPYYGPSLYDFPGVAHLHQIEDPADDRSPDRVLLDGHECEVWRWDEEHRVLKLSLSDDGEAHEIAQLRD